MARKDLKEEAGAIMLEVIAVLSLMGLMGTVLYRQIYQRNQELHNIQMASEIRVIKDAFAAWIQSNAVPISTYCKPDGHEAWTCFSAQLENVLPDKKSLSDEIANFLPEGYFFGEGNLEDNYYFKVMGYLRGSDEDPITTYYGVVIPKEGVLPDAGMESNTWNFRRAARIAMLVGIDGGAYGKGITLEEGGAVVAGAVGTWSFPAYGGSGILEDLPVTGNKTENWKENIPIYVALTGLDVFQPEIDIPEGEVGLRQDWNLALSNAAVYGLFEAGARKAVIISGILTIKQLRAVLKWSKMI